MWHHEEWAGKHSKGSNLKKEQSDSAVWRLQAVSNKMDSNARGISYGNLIQKTRVSMECLNREMETTLDKSLSSKMEKVLEEKTKLIIS